MDETASSTTWRTSTDVRNPWQMPVNPWQTVVMTELLKAIDEDNLQEFTWWLQREPDLLGESQVAQQVRTIGACGVERSRALLSRGCWSSIPRSCEE